MGRARCSDAQRLRSRARWTKTLEERFWDKVDRTGEHWLWTACGVPGGYGSFRWADQKMIGAHVASFFLSGRVLASGQQVLHACDVRRCVRPDHLFAGTQMININDMISKGRQAIGDRLNHRSQKGHLNNGAKLTTDDVMTIRRMFANGVPQFEIAKATGATRANVWAIVTGRSWGHVAPNTIDSNRT